MMLPLSWRLGGEQRSGEVSEKFSLSHNSCCRGALEQKRVAPRTVETEVCSLLHLLSFYNINLDYSSLQKTNNVIDALFWKEKIDNELVNAPIDIHKIAIKKSCSIKT